MVEIFRGQARRRWSEEDKRRLVADTLVETAKLNGVDPQAWLAAVLARLADHPAKRITDLLPWNWDAATRSRRAAPGGITAGGRRA